MIKEAEKVPSCFIYIHPIDYTHGIVVAGGLPHSIQTPVFDNCQWYVEYLCMKVLKRGDICAAETETLATGRHTFTLALSPHFQAFLSHPCVSAVLCVHTIAVTSLWQEAEHSREMADPE